MHDYHCPICQRPLRRLARYPSYLCKDCVALAVCAQGRGLDFSSATATHRHGYSARYRDDQSYYISQDCWVQGQHCRAEAAPYGGVVVQPVSTSFMSA